MNKVFLLEVHGPADEYDEGSNATWVDSVFETLEEAVKAKIRENFILRKQQVNNAQQNYYTVEERDLLKVYKP